MHGESACVVAYDIKQTPPHEVTIMNVTKLPVPSTVIIVPRRHGVWDTDGNNARVACAVMQAEAIWIAEHEKLLWQRLREAVSRAP